MKKIFMTYINSAGNIETLLETTISFSPHSRTYIIDMLGNREEIIEVKGCYLQAKKELIELISPERIIKCHTIIT